MDFRSVIAPQYSILKSFDYKYWPKPLDNPKFDCAFFVFSFQVKWFCYIFYIYLSTIDEIISMRLFHYSTVYSCQMLIQQDFKCILSINLNLHIYGLLFITIISYHGLKWVCYISMYLHLFSYQLEVSHWGQLPKPTQK